MIGFFRILLFAIPIFAIWRWFNRPHPPHGPHGPGPRGPGHPPKNNDD